MHSLAAGGMLIVAAYKKARSTMDLEIMNKVSPDAFFNKPQADKVYVTATSSQFRVEENTLTTLICHL